MMSEFSCKNLLCFLTAGGYVESGGQTPGPSIMPPPPIPPPGPVPTSRKGIRGFKLSSVTKRLPAGEIEEFAQQAMLRVLDAESEYYQRCFLVL